MVAVVDESMIEAEPPEFKIWLLLRRRSPAKVKPPVAVKSVPALPMLERIPAFKSRAETGLVVPMPTLPAEVITKGAVAATWNVATGLVVPIPTFPDPSTNDPVVPVAPRSQAVPATSNLLLGEVVPMPTLPVPEKVRLKPARGTSVAAVRVPPSLTALVVLVKPLLKVRGFS